MPWTFTATRRLMRIGSAHCEIRGMASGKYGGTVNFVAATPVASAQASLGLLSRPLLNQLFHNLSRSFHNLLATHRPGAVHAYQTSTKWLLRLTPCLSVGPYIQMTGRGSSQEVPAPFAVTDDWFSLREYRGRLRSAQVSVPGLVLYHIREGDAGILLDYSPGLSEHLEIWAVA